LEICQFWIKQICGYLNCWAKARKTSSSIGPGLKAGAIKAGSEKAGAKPDNEFDQKKQNNNKINFPNSKH
jgi:hypothetical protein